MWPRLFRRAPQVPAKVPSETLLKAWARSEWIEYQAWLFHYGFVSLADWQAQRAEAEAWAAPRPLFSILTPVYNTDPQFLAECLDSVELQSYPDWELCLVDDGSQREETLALLAARCAAEPRLRLLTLEQNQGICAATNAALAMARGDFVAFLDHDDRLAPDALYRVACHLRAAPDCEVLYSDRDMLSPQNTRFMHLFKPDWSPETLLSGNYLFHLLVYQRELVQRLGGIRAEFEGSQDYDLILRAADAGARVGHIPRVLYHWRQHEHSVALVHDAKDYAYQAGINALQESLARRGLRGTVEENRALWRGNYRVRLEAPPADDYRLLRWDYGDGWAARLNAAIAATDTPYVILLGPKVSALAADSLRELLSWLQIPELALIGGKVLDEQGRLLHAGLVLREQAPPLSLYAGHPEDNPGYMAVTAMARNVSAAHPACCALRRDTWQQLGGLDETYQGPLVWIDFGLRALAAGQRLLYTPFARFQATAWQTPQDWPVADLDLLQHGHAAWLERGDPYYNPNLSLELNDMGLDVLAWLEQRGEGK